MPRLVLLLAFLVSHASAIFQDQAGLADWHRENIGRVTHAAFLRQSRSNKIGYVATDENILAAINLRTGITAWRQVLPQGETVDSLLPGHKTLFSVSQAARQLRMWNTLDGSLLWEDALSPAEGLVSSVSAALLDDVGVATLIDGERVEMRSISSGRLLWSWRSGSSGVQMTQIVAGGSKTVYLLGRETNTSSLAAVALDAKKGKVESSKTVVDTKGTLAAGPIHVFGGFSAYIDSAKCAVVVQRLSDNKAHSTPLKSIKPSQASCDSLSIRPEVLSGHLLLQTLPTESLLISLDQDSLELSTVHSFSGQISFAAAPANDGQHMLAAVESLQDQATVSLYQLVPFEPSGSVLRSPVSLKQHGAVQSSFLNTFTKTNGMIGARVMIVTRDHALSLLQNGDTLWQREEALAKINQVEFAVPPYAASRMDGAGASASLLEDLLGKFKGVKKEAHPGSQEGQVVADKFGFRRIAVVMTDVGKVLALNTETAEIVWSRFYESGQLSHEGSILRRMVMLRNTREQSPECLVIGHDPASSHFPTFLSSLNPLTGDEGHSQTLRHSVRHAILLPDTVSEQRRLLLIVDGDLRIHAYPNTDEAQAVLARRAPDLHLHEVDKAAGVLKGFRVVAGKDDTYHCEQAWQVVLPKNEKVDTVAQRSTEDYIFSPFHVTGGHNVLFKYLNPNLLLVSTVSETAPFFKSRGAQADSGSSVHLYAIDAVTGHIVYHVAHPNSKGPTNVVLSENWVAHSYWSTRHLRTELSVVELWEDQGVEESTAQLITKNVKNKIFGAAKVSKRTGGHYVTDDSFPRSDAHSAFDKHAPLKEEQSFVLPVNVKATGVTATKLGITSKHLLLGTTSDQLLALPWQLINPRRPTGQPTEDDMAEGLMKYDAQLPFLSTSILSYNHTISNLRGIAAVPADLESTSLVMAYGVDVFFVRTAPSKGFDVLNDDFNFIGLALTVVVLSVATVVLFWLVKKTDLEYAWK